MIVTTTNSIEDYKIAEYRGIVTGTAVNVQKMKMTFNLQKYYAAISESVTEVKEKAFEQLKTNAEKLNANAVVGVTVDIELTTSNYVVVSITGTAVSIIKR
ncbi:MAG: heavy metal-binding domain-containing protein [Flavobacteriales bacterium]|nr:heavy metal-binding domain-containing protein [Flavobacteriales bacterium]